MIVAIDPGAKGGIAVYDPDMGGAQVTVWPIPETTGQILDLLRKFAPGPGIAVLEEVSGFIGKRQPGSAMFKFGKGYGFLLGVLMALNYRVEQVRPQKWQKELGIGTASACATQAIWKRKLLQRAQERYPGVPVTLRTADALLILDWYLNQRKA
jgi:hypothetical protein